MKPKATVATCLDEEELARIDKLAQERGLSRDAMLTVLVSRGLTLFETDARQAQPASRPTDPMVEGWRPLPSMPSPWLGWAILVLVGVVVFLGGWALVRALDRRARPPVAPPITSSPATSALRPPSPASSPESLPGPASSATTAAQPIAAPRGTGRPTAAPPKRRRSPEIREPWGYE